MGNMTYATSSPAATTSGQSNGPVSRIFPGVLICCVGYPYYPVRVLLIIGRSWRPPPQISYRPPESLHLINHAASSVSPHFIYQSIAHRALSTVLHSLSVTMATTFADQGRTQLQPVCQNCGTSTTPLWRRNEMGSVLCNACGLFLKLHGRPRPISLKTDVIKSRNRVKTAGQGPKRKVSADQSFQLDHNRSGRDTITDAFFSQSTGAVDANGLPTSRSDDGTPPMTVPGYRRASQRGSPGHSDRSNSPVSQVETSGIPPMPQHNSNIAPQHMFDSVTFGDQSLNSAQSLPNLQMRQPSPTSSSSAVDRNLDGPQTYEGLLAANTSLKTRVSELEVINELFRGRVAELEQSDATARRSEMIVRDSEARLRRSLEEAQRREDDLKRRIGDFEGQTENPDEPSAKKIRLSDVVDEGHSASPAQSQNDA